MHETRVSSQQVFQGKIVGVRVDQVELDGGRPGRREVVTHPGAVAIVATPDPGHVWLVQQYRYPVGRTLWELPAGTMEPGEPPAVTATRELDEEVNAAAGQMTLLLSVYPSPGFCDEIIHIYHAGALGPGSGRGGDEDERIRARLFSLDEALKLIQDGEIADAKTVAGLYAYARARQG
ncbi:MAG: NUDIX hydrolase [Bacillota bacterium]